MKVIIAGGGIGGLATAMQLAQRKFDVLVLEQASSLDDAGAGIQLSPNAMHVLAKLGLADALQDVGFEPEAVQLCHYKNGRAQFRTPLRSMCRARYGMPYLNVHRADLIDILAHGARAAGARIQLGERVKAYAQENKEVTVQANTTHTTAHTTDVLIGADGIRSAVRHHMLGDTPARFTRQLAWRGTVPASALPKSILASGTCVWLGPGRHFVAYYIRNGTLLNFVAVEECDQWNREDWVTPGKLQDVRAAFAGWDERVTAILAACSKCYLWGLFDRPPLTQWCDGHVALLGDAAHPMLPFMAQGAAMAIEDSFVLANILARHKQNLAQGLLKYETQRKARTSMLQHISRANAKLYHARPMSARLARWLQFRLGALLPSFPMARIDKIYGVNVTRA